MPWCSACGCASAAGANRPANCCSIQWRTSGGAARICSAVRLMPTMFCALRTAAREPRHRDARPYRRRGIDPDQSVAARKSARMRAHRRTRSHAMPPRLITLTLNPALDIACYCAPRGAYAQDPHAGRPPRSRRRRHQRGARAARAGRRHAGGDDGRRGDRRADRGDAGRGRRAAPEHPDQRLHPHLLQRVRASTKLEYRFVPGGAGRHRRRLAPHAGGAGDHPRATG